MGQATWVRNWLLCSLHAHFQDPQTLQICLYVCLQVLVPPRPSHLHVPTSTTTATYTPTCTPEWRSCTPEQHTSIQSEQASHPNLDKNTMRAYLPFTKAYYMSWWTCTTQCPTKKGENDKRGIDPSISDRVRWVCTNMVPPDREQCQACVAATNKALMAGGTGESYNWNNVTVKVWIINPYPTESYINQDAAIGFAEPYEPTVVTLQDVQR